LKQVAHDYDLDYKALKTRYCSKESLVEYDVPGTVTIDLNETQVVHHAEPDEYAFAEPEVVKAKAVPKAKVVTKAPVSKALSKMKKAELVEECEIRGLDSEGTVSQLRERLKDSRDPESPAKTKKKATPKKKKEDGGGDAPTKTKPKEPPVKKKDESTPKKPKKPVPVPVAPPPPVALEEEEEDEDVCRRVPNDDDGDEFELDDEADMKEVMGERLRAILMEAGELEEEHEDEDELD